MRRLIAWLRWARDPLTERRRFRYGHDSTGTVRTIFMPFDQDARA